MIARFNTILLICLVLVFISCEKVLVSPSDSGMNTADFEAAWKRVDDVYPYLDYKNINWDSLYYVYKPQAEQSRGDEIYTVLIDMLGELKDGHIYVETNGGEHLRTHAPRRWWRDRYSFSPLVVRNYFDRELRVTGEGFIEYEIIEGNIGYIYLGTFDDTFILNYFSVALDYVKDCQALILDIRHNNGGSYQNMEAVVSRFITDPFELPDLYVLGELRQNEAFQPKGPYQYTNPVVILINGVSFSTGDIFPELMRQLPQVTLVGDTTGGGSSGSTSSAPALYEMPGGKKIFVGTTDWRGYDGIPLEWRGCPPDIRIEQTQSDIESGRDKQLEYAIERLMK